MRTDGPQNLWAENAALKKRVAELEDCLMELAPYAACHDVNATITLAGRDDDHVRERSYFFKRDTLYTGKNIYRKIRTLMKDRIIANGQDYIFGR